MINYLKFSRIATLIAMTIPCSFIFAQLPVTPNLGLQLPPKHYPNWDVPMNANSVVLDNWSTTVAPKLNPVFSGIITFPITGATSQCLQVSTIGILGGTGAPCGAGGGGLTSIGLTMPTWLSVANSPLTSNGTIAVTPASGQTPHQVIGTCNTATTFAPCALVAGDIPVLPYLPSTTQLPVTKAPIASNFLTGYTSTTGVFTAAQPAFTNISGVAAPAQLPVATTSAFGAVKPDGTTVTISAGVISAAGGGGNTTSTSLTTNTIPKANGANSIINSVLTDDGTSLTYSGSGGAGASSIAARIFVGTGTAPTVAAQPGAGSGATANVDANAHDSSGTITLVTGTTPTSASAQVILTFGAVFTTTPHCVISSGNTLAANAVSNIYKTPTTTTMTIFTDGAALGAGTFIWDYVCQQ